jgi:DHA2 family multidrug resistance protein-like MFS transporter
VTLESPPPAGRREWIALAVLALPCILVVMDLTVLFLAVPKLTTALHPSSTQLLWITDIYGFMIAGALLTMGALGDRFGRRRVLLTGAAAFAIASCLAAAASDPAMLIAARAVQGAAGASLIPSAMALVFTMFQVERQRTSALGLLMAGFATGAALGPLVGGLLLRWFWWGSVFLPNVAVMAMLLVLGRRLLPEARNPAAGRPDLVSVAQSLVAVLAVIAGIKHVAARGAGVLPLAAIGAGVLVTVAFARRQRRLTQPVLAPSLFRVRAFRAALSINVVGAFVMYGTYLFISQYLQFSLGLSPLRAGLAGLPGVLMLMLVSNVVPVLVRHVRRAYVLATGLAITAGGCLVLAGLPDRHGLALIVIAGVAMSIGIAPVTVLGPELIVGAAPPEHAGAASGIAQTANELGGALGIALLGSLATAVYHADTRHADEGARDTLAGAVAAAHRASADVPAAAYRAFAHGVHVVAITAAVLLAGAAVVIAAVLRQAGAEPQPAEAGHAVPEEMAAALAPDAV